MTKRLTQQVIAVLQRAFGELTRPVLGIAFLSATVVSCSESTPLASEQLSEGTPTRQPSEPGTGSGVHMPPTETTEFGDPLPNSSQATASGGQGSEAPDVDAGSPMSSAGGADTEASAGAAGAAGRGAAGAAGASSKESSAAGAPSAGAGGANG